VRVRLEAETGDEPLENDVGTFAFLHSIDARVLTAEQYSLDGRLHHAVMRVYT